MPPRRRLAAAPLLRRFLARLPDAARVVFVWPPRHRHALPPPHGRSSGGAGLHVRLQRIAAEHPGAQMIDFRGRPGMLDDDYYWDLYHYRGSVARKMKVAAALSAAP